MAAVAGVRALPGGLGPNRLGESPSPEVGPGTAKPEADEVRAERGGGATGKYGDCDCIGEPPGEPP